MNKEKIEIKNRKGQKVVVVLEKNENQEDLAFVMHGLSGFKEQPQIRAMAEAFKEHRFTVITFDTTNTLGESGGNYEDATTTNYYEDLEDVIKWAKTQEWYQEPFYLAGHSLGGICAGLYAENYPEEIKALAPISSVISGKLTMESPNGKKDKKEWKMTGWRITESHSKPGIIKKLKWSHMEDRLKYDLIPNANKLTMPVLLAAGENDGTTPLNHQKILFDVLPGKKELKIIKGAEHPLKKKSDIKQLKQIFNEWLDKIK